VTPSEAQFAYSQEPAPARGELHTLPNVVRWEGSAYQANTTITGTTIRGQSSIVVDRLDTLHRPLSPRVGEEVVAIADTSVPRVEVASVAKTTSLLVLVVCLFSLATVALTGFVIINPLISILISAACLIFYVMGMIIDRNARAR